MAVFMATTDSAVSEREKRNLDFCRKIAAEGMVLLENNGVLPMELKGKRIALFGNGARHTVPGGTGSGEVNARTITTVEQGLEHAGAVITTKAWLAKYEKAASHAKAAFMEKMKAKYADSPEMAFWAMFSYRNPLTIAIDDADLADTGDTAVYVLSRNSGEGSDRRNTDGDYKLHRDEVNTLSLLSRHYQHLIVVLNIDNMK
ncbi:glycoside hydrolase family 3 C-terminal domain-containing protein [Lachnospiraceae bacterium 54-11]